jgi:hypothetical protein
VDNVFTTAGNPNVTMTTPVLSDIFFGGIKPDSEVSAYIHSNNITMPSDGNNIQFQMLLLPSCSCFGWSKISNSADHKSFYVCEQNFLFVQSFL